MKGSLLFDYVRVCIFEKFPPNLQMSQAHLDEFEMAALLNGYFEKIIDEFGVANEIPLEEFTWQIFDELRENNLVESFDEPALQTTYYWADLKKVASYMRSQLVDDGIYERKKKLAGDRLYKAIFAKLGDEGFSASEPVSEEPRGHESSIPASDRIVKLSDNQISDANEQVSALLDALETDNGVPEEPGARERIIGQLRAGRELIRAGEFKAYLLYEVFAKALNEILEKFGNETIKALANALLGAVVAKILEA